MWRVLAEFYIDVGMLIGWAVMVWRILRGSSRRIWPELLGLLGEWLLLVFLWLPWLAVGVVCHVLLRDIEG